MGKAIYVLCAATSIACFVLLWRGYRRSGARLLLWSGLCFLGLAGNNVVLFIDCVVLPDIDLSILRSALALVGLLLLLYGLIWEAE